MEEQNKPVEETVGIKDDLGKEIVEENMKQWNKELEMYKKNLKNIDKNIEDFKTQWEVDDGIWQIRLKDDNYKIITPTFKYQESEEYWDLVKKQLEFAYRYDKFKADNQLKQYEKSKEPLLEQIQSIKEKIAKIEGE